MRQEKEASGKTVEAAILNGAHELGVDRSLVTYEILEMPKKGFLGFGEVPARVKVFYKAGTESSALDFVNLLIADMELDCAASISDLAGNAKLIKIEGGESGVLIGHHGETLDSLQYLVNLAANKREDDEGEEKDDAEPAEGKRKYMRITVDIEDYRAKREATLRTLARRVAQKVVKYKRSVTLEPMVPYERRIIHSEIQNITGVTTTSIGVDNNRKVVVHLEGTTVTGVPIASARQNGQRSDKPARDSKALPSDSKAGRSDSRPPRRRPQKSPSIDSVLPPTEGEAEPKPDTEQEDETV